MATTWRLGETEDRAGMPCRWRLGCGLFCGQFKYVGIRCGLTEERQTIVATVEFSTESMKEMWLQIEKAMEADPKLRLVISPTLDVHTPES